MNEEKAKALFIVITIGMIWILIVWFAFNLQQYIPFSDTKKCKTYMRTVGSNVSSGQGERYKIVRGQCTEYYLGISGYGDYSVSMDIVDEFIKTKNEKCNIYERCNN